MFRTVKTSDGHQTLRTAPFTDTAELWKGVTFDAEQEALSWEPECPIEAVVSLCQSAGELNCHDLANSSQVVSSKKVLSFNTAIYRKRFPPFAFLLLSSC